MMFVIYDQDKVERTYHYDVCYLDKLYLVCSIDYSCDLMVNMTIHECITHSIIMSKETNSYTMLCMKVPKQLPNS